MPEHIELNEVKYNMVPRKSTRDQTNWRTRKPYGYGYSGTGVMTKAQATKKAESERKWHKMGYQDMEFKCPARAVKVPGGYAVFVGELQSRRVR